MLRRAIFSHYENRIIALRNVDRKSLSTNKNIFIFYKTEEMQMVFYKT